MIQWLKTCSINMEVKGGEMFKPSHLHPKLVGQIPSLARQPNETFLSVQLKFKLTINEFIIDDLTVSEFINEFIYG